MQRLSLHPSKLRLTQFLLSTRTIRTQPIYDHEDESDIRRPSFPPGFGLATPREVFNSEHPPL